MQRGQTVLNLYPLSNYSFGVKAPKQDKDTTLQGRLARLRQKYEKEGMRRSVEAVVIVHEHNHPHLLLLQVGQSYFRLPGGRLRPGEDEVEGLKRKLTNCLAPTNETLRVMWDVGECIATFWRPSFDTIFYPYVPAHITRPKECRRVFVVALPDRCVFAVPRNLKLVAVPLFELYDNIPRYGPIICAVPALVSRFRLNIFSSQSLVPTAPHIHTGPPSRPALPPQSAANGGQEDHQPHQQ